MAFFPWPREKKKKVLIKPIYFNIITFSPKCGIFCQNPAHYRGFSFLSDGFMLKCYQRVNSWAWGHTVGLAARMEPGVMHPQGTCVQGSRAFIPVACQGAVISTGRMTSRKHLQNFLFVAYFATENS